MRGGVQHQQAHAWIMLIVCLTLGGCGGDAEQRSAESGVVSTHEEELSGNATTDARRATVAAVGRVVAGKNLGMTISGAGSTAATRSLEVLEQRVQSFLPHLQAVYERERQKQPNLMGSVDVYLTIEPNGNVSDLRFPKARVSDERFLDAIFDPITMWVFPQAEDTAQLRITFLFVPPSFDLASVTAWERQVVPTSHNPQRQPAATTVIAGAVLPPPEATSPPTLSPSPIPALVPTLPDTTGEGEDSSITITRAKTTQTAPPVASQTSPLVQKKRPPPAIADSGWYQIKRSTALRAEPRRSAALVALLKPGTRVRVVGIVSGTWLEVRSVSNRRPGYLHRTDAQRVDGPR